MRKQASLSLQVSHMNDRMAHWEFSVYTDTGIEAHNVYILHILAFRGLIV